MEYQVISIKVAGVLGMDIPKTTAELAKEINQQIALGWEPVGGVTTGPHNTHLLQAMIKRR